MARNSETLPELRNLVASKSVVTVDVQRHHGVELEAASRDHVVVEEPLSLLLDDDPLAITMRTPGHDRELATGFLLAEGIIASAEDLLGLAPCGRTGDEGRDNTLAIQLAPTAKLPVDPTSGELVRRGTLTSSACGVCGRTTIDDLMMRFAVANDQARVPRAVIAGALAEIRDHQPIFAVTGGCHAASIVRFDGERICTFEDVGRHNAVDKAVGACVLARRLPLTEHLLVVSGRTSFEIVQKALAAGISAVASVSAPSSLAIALAKRTGLVLAGFVRDDAMTVYVGEARVK